MSEHDHPFYEVAEEAAGLIGEHVIVFQKFTCDQCGQRLTMEVPNTFYKTGTCDQCGHVTDIEANGCNYMLCAAAPEVRVTPADWCGEGLTREEVNQDG